MEFKIKTKGDSSPRGKNRVYFTCHKDDYSKCFDRICADIFATQDCAVYYTEDMEDSAYEYIDVDLGQMNLFVIPISMKILSEPNRALDIDFRFACEKHIPVLPIAIELGLQSIFSREDKFGKLQYLSTYSKDATAISYEEKMKKFLASVLVGDELAEKVRKAFDAYVFLSYRKKDRAYANELMRLIHRDPLCRDIAIWYDEFLVPGRNFEESIAQAIKQSDMFTFLVTPNITEAGNYVQRIEYPEAKKTGKGIVPVEMVATDHKLLEELFEDIPECIKGEENKEFFDRFISILGMAAKKENDSDPEHNYLIGIAYRDGINVEVDRKRGAELIEGAAKAGVPEAMEAMIYMYRDGNCFSRDMGEYVNWTEKIVDYYRKTREDDDLLTEWMHFLAQAYLETDKYEAALELFEKVYEIWRVKRGELDDYTLTALANIGFLHSNLGDYDKSLEIMQKIYDEVTASEAEENRISLTVLGNIALVKLKKAEYKKAFEIAEYVYYNAKKLFGDEDSYTLKYRNNMAQILSCMSTDERGRAVKIEDEVYKKSADILGEDNPDTILYLSNTATFSFTAGFIKEAVNREQEAYEKRKKIFGPEHVDTMFSLALLLRYKIEEGDVSYVKENLEKLDEFRQRNLLRTDPDFLNVVSDLALLYSLMGDTDKSLELNKDIYEKRKAIFGEEHPDTILSLNNIVVNYCDMGEFGQVLDAALKVYKVWSGIYDDSSPSMMLSLENLSFIYRNIGEYEKARELYERLLADRDQIYSGAKEARVKTLKIMSDYALTLGYLGRLSEALEIDKKILKERMSILTEDDPALFLSMNNIAMIYLDMQEYDLAYEMEKKAYEGWKKCLDKSDPNLTLAVLNMISILRQQGNYFGIAEYQKELYEIYKETKGEKDKSTVIALNDLALAYFNAGNVKKAIEINKITYENMVEVLGENAPDTLTCKNNMKVYLDAAE